jgi:hypothetical protein
MLMLFYQAFRSNSVFYAKMVSNFRRKVRGCEMLFLEVAEGMKIVTVFEYGVLEDKVTRRRGDGETRRG